MNKLKLITLNTIRKYLVKFIFVEKKYRDTIINPSITNQLLFKFSGRRYYIWSHWWDWLEIKREDLLAEKLQFRDGEMYD